MKIAVGSTNPIKIAAVRTTVQRIWLEAEVTGISVPSGVSDMPMSDAETILGAKNRGLAAREQLTADFGFGLEGGVHLDSVGGWMLQSWAVVVDRNGRFGIGGGGRIPLPTLFMERVLAGEELGLVLDDVLGQTNVKQKGGAVGLLTAGLVKRQDAFALAVAYALAPFLVPEFYPHQPESQVSNSS